MQKEILINKNFISRNTKPYVIAEIGSNFNQNLDTANSLIKIAKKCGANAVKFQLFNAVSLYPNDKKMNKIFKSIELNPSWIKSLIKTANNLQIEILFSCFDFNSFNYLKKFKLYISSLNSAFSCLGSNTKKILDEEKKVVRRNGLYFSKSLKKGHKLTKNDLKLHPPAIYLRDMYLDVIIGTNLKFDVNKSEPVKLEFLNFGQK